MASGVKSRVPDYASAVTKLTPQILEFSASTKANTHMYVYIHVFNQNKQKMKWQYLKQEFF